MQRSISLTGREYDMVLSSLKTRIDALEEKEDNSIEAMSLDEKKMLVEEHSKLVDKLLKQSNFGAGGTFIDNQRT